jgi:hypothetical protein
MIKSKLFGLASVGAVAIAIVGGQAVANAPEEAKVRALKENPRVTLSPAMKRLAESPTLAEEGLRLGEARDAGSIGGAGRWTLIPSEDGACLAGPESTFSCATAKSVNRGELLAIKAPQAMPERLSPEQLELAQAGKPLAGSPQSLAGASVVGVAPDGVAKVRFRDASKKVQREAEVSGNVYRVDDVDLDSTTIELVSAEG